MSQDDIEMICAVLAARESGGCNGRDSKCGEVPVKINEDFSCILGDGFNFMDCPKVPIHHESKIGFCSKVSVVCLR